MSGNLKNVAFFPLFLWQIRMKTAQKQFLNKSEMCIEGRLSDGFCLT